MGLLGALLIWPIEAAISWATWYALRSSRERIFMFISQKFRKMLTAPYNLDLLMEDWVMTNREITKQLKLESLKKRD